MKARNGLVVAYGTLIGMLLAISACQTAAPAPTQAPAATAAPTKAAAAAPTAASTAAPAAATQPAAAPATAAPATSATLIPVKVGLSVPYTGSVARNGNSIDHFARIGLDDLNAKGGFRVGDKSYTFDMSATADDKCNAEAGREAANKLILSDKVKFIIGGCAGPVTSAQPIAEPAGVMIITMSAADASLGKDHPLTFIAQSVNLMRVNALYEWLGKEHPEVKRILYVGSDDQTGRSNATYVKAQVKDRGLTLVGEEYYPLDLKDVGPLATRITRQSFDAIDFATTAGRATVFVPLVRAIYEQGFKGLKYATSAEGPAQKEAAGVLEGFTSTLLYDRNAAVVTAGEKDTMAKYIKKYGEAEMEITSMQAYNIPIVLAQAMTKAGTVDDAAKVAQALRDMEFDTNFGKSRMVGAKTFGAPAAMEQPIYMNQVRNGQVVTFTSVKGTLP